MGSRQVLTVFHCPQVHSAHHGISLDGWQLAMVEGVVQAKELIARENFCVGLIGFDCHGECLPDNDLADLLSQPRMHWIALISKDLLADANMASRLGRIITTHCFDFHTLPVDRPRLTAALGHAYGMAQLAASSCYSPLEHVGALGMIGRSTVMRDLFADIPRIAGADAPVLITGESGTGKELSALAIHKMSRRREGPFMAVNCAALPGGLIQSELFGHERGAFTGAFQRKLGRIELAAGGTLFLDEIGDLSPELQVNLLRFLQEKTFRRLGGLEELSADLRVIAATHADLEQRIQEGKFREDLYYRLDVLRLQTPPLRARHGDIELLARFFLQQLASETGQRAHELTDQALRVMNRYHWPGNVRELMNRLHRAVVMCDANAITPSHLSLQHLLPYASHQTLHEARSAAEQVTIQKALREFNHNVSQAARSLGISRRALYRLIKKHEVRLSA